MNTKYTPSLRVYSCCQKIYKSIHAIYGYIGLSTEEVFLGNMMMQDAVIMRVATIGEEVASILKVDKMFPNEFPDIEWHGIRGMRNLIVHDYYELDNNTLWKIVTQDLPPLEQIISQVINDNAEYYPDMEEDEDDDDSPSP